MTKNTESKIALAIMLCLCAIGSIAAFVADAAENERNTEMANETPIATDYSGVREYIGARYVPVFANPLEWSDTRGYEPLTIVSYNGNSYTSMQSVPTGIDILNTEYWASTGNYNAQVEAYRQEVQQWSGKINIADANASNAVNTAGSAVTTANEAKESANDAMGIASEALTAANKQRYISFDDTLFTDWNSGINYKEFFCLYFPETNSIIFHLYIYTPDHLVYPSDEWATVCRVPEQLRPIFETWPADGGPKLHNVIQRWVNVTSDTIPHHFGDLWYDNGLLKMQVSIGSGSEKKYCDRYLITFHYTLPAENPA